MRNFLLGVAVAAGIALILVSQRRREAERAAEEWAAHTDPVD